MKRKASSGRVKERMKKLKLSVQQFVERSRDEVPAGAPERGEPEGGRGKSRKELRKEKRQSKKLRKKQYYERRYLGAPEQPSLSDGIKSTASHNAKPKKSKQGVKEERKPTKEGEKAPAEERKPPKEERKRTKDQRNPQPHQGDPKKAKGSREEVRRKALLEANEQEEKEIRRLERSLRMNKRKNKSSLPQAFAQDGLDYILGVLEPGGSMSGLYEEANMTEKLHKLSEEMNDADPEKDPIDKEESSDEESGSMDVASTAVLEDTLSKASDDESEDNEEDDKGSEFNDFDTETEGSEEEENDASARSDVEQKTIQGSGSKYVPPQMRESGDSVDAKKREELERLKKSVKGLLNRLSEPNMASTSRQMEELYMANSRKDMNETLTSVLMSACITRAIMPERLMSEHVLLVSILHHTVGIEVGAHILESLVKEFDKLHSSDTDTDSKECENLVVFIGDLYNFQVIDCALVFDLLRRFMVKFTERDMSLILHLLKNVGFSLRKDNAWAMKDIIEEAQKKANEALGKFKEQTRASFLLNILLALKSNDVRKIPLLKPEAMEGLRKLQRTLIRSSSSGSDPRLRVSLASLLDADKVGRWWIVGSSWSGTPMIDSSGDKPQHPSIGKVSAKIMDLARKQRMNTDIRRNIFCVLMTSEDFLDAFEKLIKLGLKDHQEREIVHILIDCCLQEKTYNPFYAFLSSKFCEYDRRFQMTFQFSMWDKFRDLENLAATAFTNLVNLLSHLIKSKSLPLSVFKVIEFSELDKFRVSFLRQVLHKLLMDAEVEDLAQIFGKISENAKLGMLREGLKLFITHFLLKNIRAQRNAEEAELLVHRADLAVKALQAKENRLRL
uniref:Nucleolar MIF4G domain-containing protein 1 n=1 Tax=Leptobrachium leishanense TaxID=445787 RepID=A0A8C5WCF6_9ANUR